MDPSLGLRTLSWNIRNVKPKYSQMNLDFFASADIVNVQDLFEADTDHLCSRLMAFGEFKAACAFAQWKSRLNKLDFRREKKVFYDLYHPECAKLSIMSWRLAAEAAALAALLGTDEITARMRSPRYGHSDQPPLHEVFVAAGDRLVDGEVQASSRYCESGGAEGGQGGR